jgi:hypothetical protein
MKINQKGFVIPLIIAIVAILAVGGGYWYYKTSYFPPNPIDRGNIVGGDSDIHGCKASAGYSWCEVKNKCLRVWEEKCEATTTTKTSCTPNWQCGWGECKNGYQGMTAVDSNNCGLSSAGVNIMCPALARECVVESIKKSSVNVIYPKGGEIINTGSVQVIKWWDDSDAGDKDIQLINQSTGLISIIVANNFGRSSGIDGTYAYQWNISNLATPGKYKIKICKSGTSECGISDSSFEII